MNIKAEDRVGKTFNDLKIVEIVGRAKDRTAMCRCECKCGNECVCKVGNVVSGRTKSCGCARVAHAKALGLSRRKEMFCRYCGAEHFAKGMCKLCYARFRHNGTVEYKHKRREIVVPEESQ